MSPVLPRRHAQSDPARRACVPPVAGGEVACSQLEPLIEKQASATLLRRQEPGRVRLVLSFLGVCCFSVFCFSYVMCFFFVGGVCSPFNSFFRRVRRFRWKGAVQQLENHDLRVGTCFDDYTLLSKRSRAEQLCCFCLLSLRFWCKVECDLYA